MRIGVLGVLLLATLLLLSAYIWVNAPSGSISSIVHVHQVAPADAVRVLIADSDWARRSAETLQSWRNTLFSRMADFYKREEAIASSNGTAAIGRIEPAGLKRYDLFNPYLQCPDGNLTHLGPEGEGGKFLCMTDELRAPGCVIYSLGSRQEYDFEESVLEETPCEVHTFDCTVEGKSLGPRHFYHKICVGQAGGPEDPQEKKDFMTFDGITAMLNHTRVDLLKIDIEGWEFDVLSGFKPSCSLPLQIAMEVHFSSNILYDTCLDSTNFQNLYWALHDVSLGELALFFFHLADLGYGVVSREDNIPWGVSCCAEFTLVRVEKLQGC